jgi:ribosomal RNA-processing protein 12
MRMPVAELQAFLPAICEGILLWAEDSKNKFRLKVRVILEKLARRCGFEALEAAVPPTHRALLTHIRKQHNRKERKKGDATPRMEWDLADDIEEEDGPDDDEDMRSKRSGMARTTNTRKTAARSDWNSDIFGDDDDDVDDKNYDDGGRRSLAGRSSARTAFAPGRGTGNGGRRAFGSARSAPIAAGKAARLLPSGGGGGDPLDLLDATTSRVMMRAAAGVAGKATRGNSGNPDGDFTLGRDGRMIINDDEALLGGKRKRNEAEDAGFDSDDSDFEDLKGFSGLSLALRGAKSVAAAPTLAASMGGKSLAAKSTGGRSARTAGAGGQREGQSRRAQHTGDRFKARKSGAGGDVKGNSKVEPYAYWPLDRKLMNRRASKAKGAKVGLDKVVRAAKDGAAKGRKAKRTRDV